VQKHVGGNIDGAEACWREQRQCGSMLEGKEMVQKHVGGDIDP
jgi:hypothetical protein